MNCLIDPSVLMTDDNSWRNDQYRERFIGHFVDHMAKFSETSASILWNSLLDGLIQTSFFEQPWVSDPDWGNYFIPVFYKNVMTRIELLDDDLTPAEASHSLILSCCNAVQALDGFNRLAHSMISRSASGALCLGLPNIHTQAISYNCTCHDYVFNPILIKRTIDWNQFVDISAIWPASEDETDKIYKGIEFTLSSKIGKCKQDIVYSEIVFSRDFVEDLIGAKASAEDILFAIAKRVVQCQKDATKDRGLKDEPVRGKVGERRFRVSGETRIHYSYCKGGIEFLRFYREGCHDDGL